MIEAYWNEVFGQFKVSEGKFDIPGFPEPLMSPHFGVKNILGPAPEHSKKLSFKLCEFPALGSKIQKKFSYEPLEKADKRSFWEFQAKNEGSYLFIQKLLPFLLTLTHPHYHFYQEDEEGLILSTIVGVSSAGCFLFNLSVRSSARKQGFAKVVLQDIRECFPDRPVFFWTVHPWFTFEGAVTDYHVLVDQ